MSIENVKVEKSTSGDRLIGGMLEDSNLELALVSSVLQETWKFLDAAAFKPRPSEYLGLDAIRSVQGLAQREVEKDD